MDKEIIISITGMQSIDDIESDTISLVTKGKYYIKDSSHFIVYKESELTGFDGSTTTIKVDGQKVSMIRYGASNTQFVFEQGIVYNGHYETPYGCFTISVLPKNVDIDISPDEGNLTIDYSLEMAGSGKSYNHFNINFHRINYT